MKHWNIWQRYQAVHAYGTGHSGDSPASASIREVAGKFLWRRTGPMLGIGCGGAPEAAWLESVVDRQNLYLLTTHVPEATCLAENGYLAAIGDMHYMPYSKS